MAVLAPGPMQYAVHRTLFTFRDMTIKESPGPFALHQEEAPLYYRTIVQPDFQDTHAKAWALVWKERVTRWFHRRYYALKRALGFRKDRAK